jgi:hypothetical protein
LIIGWKSLNQFRYAGIAATATLRKAFSSDVYLEHGLEGKYSAGI